MARRFPGPLMTIKATPGEPDYLSVGFGTHGGIASVGLPGGKSEEFIPRCLRDESSSPPLPEATRVALPEGWVRDIPVPDRLHINSAEYPWKAPNYLGCSKEQYQVHRFLQSRPELDIPTELLAEMLCEANALDQLDALFQGNLLSSIPGPSGRDLLVMPGGTGSEGLVAAWMDPEGALTRIPGEALLPGEIWQVCAAAGRGMTGRGTVIAARSAQMASTMQLEPDGEDGLQFEAGASIQLSGQDRLLSHMALHPSMPSQALIALSDGVVQFWDSSDAVGSVLSTVFQGEVSAEPSRHLCEWAASHPCVALCCSSRRLYQLDLRARQEVAASLVHEWQANDNSTQLLAPSDTRPFEVMMSHDRQIHLFDLRMHSRPLLVWEHSHVDPVQLMVSGPAPKHEARVLTCSRGTPHVLSHQISDCAQSCNTRPLPPALRELPSLHATMPTELDTIHGMQGTHAGMCWCSASEQLMQLSAHGLLYRASNTKHNPEHRAPAIESGWMAATPGTDNELNILSNFRNLRVPVLQDIQDSSNVFDSASAPPALNTEPQSEVHELLGDLQQHLDTMVLPGSGGNSLANRASTRVKFVEGAAPAEQPQPRARVRPGRRPAAPRKLKRKSMGF